MPTILTLGIVEQPYSVAPTPKKVAKASKRPRKAKATKTESGTQTTGDVATWLENKYGVYQAFVDDQKDAINEALRDSVEASVETYLTSGQQPQDPFAAANSTIDALFKAWLASGAIEKLGIAGVPTQASIERRSLRFKNKQSKGPRPSFINTGLYEANFHSWTETK